MRKFTKCTQIYINEKPKKMEKVKNFSLDIDLNYRVFFFHPFQADALLLYANLYP